MLTAANLGGVAMYKGEQSAGQNYESEHFASNSCYSPLNKNTAKFSYLYINIIKQIAIVPHVI